VEEAKRPLFEKSGAKTSFMLGYGLVADKAHSPALIKFFCFFLFTKRSLRLPLPDAETWKA
jgi:hypothetical protein